MTPQDLPAGHHLFVAQTWCASGDLNSRDDHAVTDSHKSSVVSGSFLPDDRGQRDTQGSPVVGESITPASQIASDTQSDRASEGLTIRDDQELSDSHSQAVVPDSSFRTSQTDRDSQRSPAGADPSLPDDQPAPDTQSRCVVREFDPRTGYVAADDNIHTSGASTGSRFPGDHSGDDTQNAFVAGELDQLSGHIPSVTQPTRAAEPLTPQPTIPAAITTGRSSTGVQTGGDQRSFDSQKRNVATSTSPPTIADAIPRDSVSAGTQDSGDHEDRDSQARLVTAHSPRGPARATTALISHALDLADPLLSLAAEVVEDLEKVRIANENRLRQLTRTGLDKDGRNRGFELPPDHPDVKRLAALVEGLKKIEDDAIKKNLEPLMKRHPLGSWMTSDAAKGVGLKQGGRLLAAIGDPYWNTLYNRPRTVSELWSYSGYGVHKLPGDHKSHDTHVGLITGAPTSTDHSAHVTQSAFVGGDPGDGSAGHYRRSSHNQDAGVAVSRMRGQKSNWSATAKMRAFNIADSCLKQLRAPCYVVKGEKNQYDHAEHVEGCQCSPYRVVYDLGRNKYAKSVHQFECKRCGPTGKPALVGSDLSDGHKHMRAIRLASKEILKDLWREAKRLHELPAATFRPVPIRRAPLEPSSPKEDTA